MSIAAKIRSRLNNVKPATSNVYPLLSAVTLGMIAAEIFSNSPTIIKFPAIATGVVVGMECGVAFGPVLPITMCVYTAHRVCEYVFRE